MWQHVLSRKAADPNWHCVPAKAQDANPWTGWNDRSLPHPRIHNMCDELSALPRLKPVGTSGTAIIWRDNLNRINKPVTIVIQQTHSSRNQCHNTCPPHQPIHEKPLSMKMVKFSTPQRNTMAATDLELQIQRQPQESQNHISKWLTVQYLQPKLCPFMPEETTYHHFQGDIKTQLDVLFNRKM